MAKDRLRDWIPETLSCLLTFDKATDRWLGRCLDLDLSTSGKTDKAAWENLGKVIKAHVETCWRRNREALTKHRAPQEDWDLFKHLSDKKKPFRSDKITFDLLEPEFAEEVEQLWMRGLEFLPAGSDCANKQATSAVSSVH